MGNYYLLDCTLRDGGYLNDWEFGQNGISNIFVRLVSANVDVIEVGFLDERRTFDRNRSIMPNTASVRDIYGEMLDTKDDAGNYCLLNGEEAMGQYLEFRFEGAGRDTRKLFKGSAKWNDGSWHSVNMKGHADSKNVENNASKTIPLEFDLFGAMTVVIRNAEVYGVFFRTSTLPDNYLDYPYENVATCVIQDGIYDFYTYQHDWWTESGGFAAFQLENNGDTKIPAIYDELTYNSENGITGEGINIHHNYNSDDKRYSAGCLTVDKDDWAQYMKLYGFAYDKNRENKSWDENGRLMGKIVVKRLIDIKINADSGTYSNVKEEAK